MKKEGVVLLFSVLLFASVFVPSTTAVPSSRRLRSIITEPVSHQHLYDEFQVKGRMGVEIADYSGTGANNHHDPVPPAGNS